MNCFRMTKDKSLDREYLRICAVYKLLKTGKINKKRAIEISYLPIKGCYKKSDNWLTGTIELWLNSPLRNGS